MYESCRSCRIVPPRSVRSEAKKPPEGGGKSFEESNPRNFDIVSITHAEGGQRAPAVRYRHEVAIYITASDVRHGEGGAAGGGSG